MYCSMPSRSMKCTLLLMKDDKKTSHETNVYRFWLDGEKHLHSICQHNQFCGIVEHNAHAFVAQLIPEAIFVTVIDPF